MECHFTLEYWINDDWYVGRIKEMLGVFSQGKTLAKLENNIKDAYNMIISEKQKNADFPINTKIKNFVVQV